MIETASDRITRILAASVGIGSIVFTLLGMNALIAQFSLSTPAFSWAAVILFCGVPPVMGVIAIRGSLRVVRALAVLHISSTLVLLALWEPAIYSPDGLPHDAAPWIINMITVCTCAAVIVLPTSAAWVYLFVIAASSGLVRFVVYGGGDPSTAFQDAVMISLFSSVLLALLLVTIRAGKEEDAASLAAQRAGAAAAAAETLDQQRTLYQAFTHDDILSTLLSAGRNTPGTLELTRESARRAITKLEDFTSNEFSTADIEKQSLEALFRQSAEGTDIEVTIDYADPKASTLTTPMPVAAALSSAVAEALRNSVRHAGWPDGRPVQRSARAVVSSGGIDVDIVDDGRGFTPRRVGFDRLGVRVSILHRVNSLPGCRAEIDSAPGRGTTVRLRWNAAEAAREH